MSIPIYLSFITSPLIPAIPISIISLVFIYRLAAALKEPNPWLYAIFGLIPYVNVVSLLVINSRATTALKVCGVHVGLLGARKDDLAKLTTNTP